MQWRFLSIVFFLQIITPHSLCAIYEDEENTPQNETYFGVKTFGKLIHNSEIIADLDEVHEDLRNLESGIVSHIRPIFKDAEKDTNNIVLAALGFLIEKGETLEYKSYRVPLPLDVLPDSEGERISIFESKCKYTKEDPQYFNCSVLEEKFLEQATNRYRTSLVPASSKKSKDRKFREEVEQKVNNFYKSINNLLSALRDDTPLPTVSDDHEGKTISINIRQWNEIKNFIDKKFLILQNSLDSIEKVYKNFQILWEEDLPYAKGNKFKKEFLENTKLIRMATNNFQAKLIEQLEKVSHYTVSLSKALSLTNMLHSSFLNTVHSAPEFGQIESLQQHLFSGENNEKPSEQLAFLHKEKEKLEALEDKLQRSIYDLYGTFWHSEQRVLATILDQDTELWSNIKDTLEENEKIVSVFFHIHSRFNFCLYCRFTLLRFAHSQLPVLIQENLSDKIDLDLSLCSLPIYLLGSFSEPYDDTKGILRNKPHRFYISQEDYTYSEKFYIKIYCSNKEGNENKSEEDDDMGYEQTIADTQDSSVSTTEYSFEEMEGFIDHVQTIFLKAPRNREYTFENKKFIKGKVSPDGTCLIYSLDLLFPAKGISRDAFAERIKDARKANSNIKKEVNLALAAELYASRTNENKNKKDFSGIAIDELFLENPSSDLDPAKIIPQIIKNESIINEIIDSLSKKETYFCSPGIELICRLFNLNLDIYEPSAKENSLRLLPSFRFDGEAPPQAVYFASEHFDPLCDPKDLQTRERLAANEIKMIEKKESFYSDSPASKIEEKRRSLLSLYKAGKWRVPKNSLSNDQE